MEVCSKINSCSVNNNNNSANPTTHETEITCLSPSSPQPSSEELSPEQQQQPTHAIFAKHLQMKLKSHLEESSSSSSSSEEYFTNSSSNDDNTNSSSEIFYDFDDVVYDEELTSDYGTGGSNTIVDDDAGLSTRSNSSTSSSGSSSVVCGVDNNSSNLMSQGNDQEEGERDDDDSSSSSNNSRVRYQRSSSLKSGKTPPGTPMKKIVRFADAMGLDLIDIKMFVDEIPRVPKEAYRDLHIPDYSGPTSSPPTSLMMSSDPFSFSYDKPFSLNFTRNSSLNFVPLFHQPVSMPDFFDKIRDQKVLLENAYITQETIPNTQNQSAVCKHVIKGTVRVMNLDFHKSVYIRYTYDDWKSFIDFQATYIPGSCDGFSDRFEFRVEIDESRLPPPYVRDDAKVQFACRFHCQGSQFWDNNQSRNYVFQNVPIQRPAPAPSSTNNNRYLGLTSSRYSSFDDFDYDDKLELKSNPPPCLPVDNNATKPPPPLPTSITNSTTTTRVSEPITPPASSSSASAAHEVPDIISPTTTGYLSGGGGGSHMTASLYSPTSFYESAYGCYNQYGSACFY